VDHYEILKAYKNCTFADANKIVGMLENEPFETKAGCSVHKNAAF
jgi:hypothetical protein